MPRGPPPPTPPQPGALTLDTLRSAAPPEDTLHRFSLCNGGHGSGSDPRGHCARLGPELQAQAVTRGALTLAVDWLR